ncbi:hypothetical protein NDJ29_12850 [Vibrio alginolyticus]|uniref:hypothetical protein n=1 Tax=Vibrio alginolyticus TaxID=663 RepID=UPI00215F736B|nr:hypothetical protein [Vibrio alginolyticus]EMC2462846.1 hypothetical protein [Vibrio alginolyticus]MCS0195685.1 hypothetical protein [Vibrio alginolyticus]
MSVIKVYKDPLDLYMKLIREGKRVWQANEIEDTADHFFNFCVTSLSLRDWCINSLKLDGKDKADFYNKHSQSKWLKYCGDIANSSKHFSLKKERKSNVSGVNEKIETLVPMFMDGSYRHDLSIERPSLEIINAEGSSENLMMVLFWTCTEWINIFKSYGLEVPPDSSIGDMFMSIYYPD